MAQKWTQVESMAIARYGHTATLLPSGEVLAAGGAMEFGGGTGLPSFFLILNSTEIYSLKGEWRSGPALSIPRRGHSATRLPNGDVLIVGGSQTSSSSEIYDSKAGAFRPSATQPLVARTFHTATLMPNGQVVIVGGADDSRVELFDPATETWSVLSGADITRSMHTTTLLPSGDLFVVGGVATQNAASNYIATPNLTLLDTTDVLDVSTGSVTAGPDLLSSRAGHSTVLTRTGEILVIGGGYDNGLDERTDSSSLSAFQALGTFYGAPGLGGAALLPSGDAVSLGGNMFGPEGDWDFAALAATLLSSDGVTRTSVLTSPVVGGTRLPAVVGLLSGKLFFVGGLSGNYATDATTRTVTDAWVFDPEDSWTSLTWTDATTPLQQSRTDHTLTTLPSGNVLMVSEGASELLSFQSPDLQSQALDPLGYPRTGHTATLLSEPALAGSQGLVAIAGGTDGSGAVRDIELFVGEAAVSTWVESGSLLEDRIFHTATLLASGKVLFAGGGTDTAEVWDPSTGLSVATGSMNLAREKHDAFLLENGEVLVVGGHNGLESEIYSPQSGTWRLQGLASYRDDHFASAFLQTGEPLIAGSSAQGVLARQTEIFTGHIWTPAGAVSDSYGRHGARALTLPNGQVLLAEGFEGNFNRVWSHTFFDRQTFEWGAVFDDPFSFEDQNYELAWLAPTAVVKAGGTSDVLDFLDLSSLPGSAARPRVTAVDGASPPTVPVLRYDQPFTVSVAKPATTYESSSGATSSSASNVPLLRIVNLENGHADSLIPVDADYDQDPIVLTVDEVEAQLEPGWYHLFAFANGQNSPPLTVRVECSVAASSLDGAGMVTGDQDIVVDIGTTATFSVQAFGATSYRWERCFSGACSTPADWVDVAGATGPTYETPIVQTSDAGLKHRAIAENACATAMSDTFTLIPTFSDGFETGDTSKWSSRVN